MSPGTNPPPDNDRRRRFLAAVLAAAGILAAIVAQYDLFHADRLPGDPFPWLPAMGLLVGALLFALGFHLFRDTQAHRGLQREPAFDGPPLESEFGGWDVLRKRWLPLGGALLLGSAAALVYARRSYHPLILVGWIGSWFLASWAMWPCRRRAFPSDRLELREIGFLGLIVGISALLLLPFLSRMPYTIGSDEIYMINSVREFVDGTHGDPLGLMWWWRLPALYFAVASKYALLFGSSVEAIRLLTGLTGVALLVPLYLWVRTLHGVRVAVVAVLLLAFAHSFIGWSRLALHVNSSVLLLVLALALLTLAWRDGCPLKLLWGGIALGWGFYAYLSSQIGIVLWGGFLGLILVTRRVPPKTAVTLGLLSLAGFLLSAAPMLVHAVTDFEGFTERAGAISIANPVALETLGELWELGDPRAIQVENVTRGLLAFNVPYPSVNYWNQRHGIVDPATGILLWLGLATLLVRRRHLGLLLAATGFALVYLPNLFTEQAPAYSRLLISLPFVAALSAEALVGATGIFGGLAPRRRRGRTTLLGAAVLALAVWNLAIYRHYVVDDLYRGPRDPLTAIGRYLDSNIAMPNPVARFFGAAGGWNPRDRVLLVASDEYPVFRWADSYAWQEWISFFVGSDMVAYSEDLEPLLVDADGPHHGRWDRLVVFLPTAVWVDAQDRLRERYPQLRFRTITPTRQLVALEIER